MIIYAVRFLTCEVFFIGLLPNMIKMFIDIVYQPLAKSVPIESPVRWNKWSLVISSSIEGANSVISNIAPRGIHSAILLVNHDYWSWKRKYATFCCEVELL